jgi:hypothetical protein
MITSGSIFVSDEDESGIKRWTDVFFWSPSRILSHSCSSDQGGDPASGGGPIAAKSELSRPCGETTRLGTEKCVDGFRRGPAGRTITLPPMAIYFRETFVGHECMSLDPAMLHLFR